MGNGALYMEEKKKKECFDCNNWFKGRKCALNYLGYLKCKDTKIYWEVIK